MIQDLNKKPQRVPITTVPESLSESIKECLWGSDNICIKEKKKFGGKNLAQSLCGAGLGDLVVEFMQKNENGEKDCKMVENWVLFCIKMNGGFVVFKPF